MCTIITHRRPTINTLRREHLFDCAVFRELAENAWLAIPRHPHARHARRDEWVLMPNHLHGILAIVEQGEAAGSIVEFATETSGPAASPLQASRPTVLKSGSVGGMIGNFKSRVTRRINALRRTPGGKVWQRGYYDHIVRDDREWAAIRQYIRDNPLRWAEDRDNLDALLAKMRYVP